MFMQLINGLNFGFGICRMPLHGFHHSAQIEKSA